MGEIFMRSGENSMIHPAFSGLTLDGKNTKENVIRYLTAGMCLEIDEKGNHWIRGGKARITPVYPETDTQPFIRPWSVVLHSNAAPHYTFWQNLWKFVSRQDINIEPTFQLERDGLLYGFIPTNRRADCNASANYFINRYGERVGALSFETADEGASTLEKTVWNNDQIDTLIKANTILCLAYKINCTTPAAWDDSGIGHHCQFTKWSVYVGKTCPGAARIRQMDFIRAGVANNMAAFFAQCGGSCGTR
jgi:hypothetical protein